MEERSYFLCLTNILNRDCSKQTNTSNFSCRLNWKTCQKGIIETGVMNIQEAIQMLHSEWFDKQTAATRWADLGAGSGLFSAALSRLLLPGSSIYAVDKKVVPHIQTANEGVDIVSLTTDFEKENLVIGRLDGVLMANSLHYVCDKISFLSKCKNEFANNVFLIVEYDTDKPVGRWVPYPISFLSLYQLFWSRGYKNITKLAQRPSMYGHSQMYSAIIQ